MAERLAFGTAVVVLIVAALRAIPVLRSRPTLAVWLSLPLAWVAIVPLVDALGFDEKRSCRLAVIGAAGVLLWLKRRP